MNTEELTRQTAAYMDFLEQEERSPATLMQYRRDILRFLAWGEELPLSKETVIRYKEVLQETYKATSVNAKLAALNGFLTYLGKPELRVKQLKIQRQAYCSREKELVRQEYARLVKAARGDGNERLSLVLQTLCSTGIRVSELSFITVEAVEAGEAAVSLKGKNRTVLLPEKLCKMLRRYIARRGIRSGPVFVSRNGNPLDRSYIWRQMKALCKRAGVAAKKVFPHNMRHLFARCFYAVDKDLAKLADILGHSSINTTRIYIISSGAEHRARMDQLGLVLT